MVTCDFCGDVCDRYGRETDERGMVHRCIPCGILKCCEGDPRTGSYLAACLQCGVTPSSETLGRLSPSRVALVCVWALLQFAPYGDEFEILKGIWCYLKEDWMYDHLLTVRVLDREEKNWHNPGDAWDDRGYIPEDGEE